MVMQGNQKANVMKEIDTLNGKLIDPASASKELVELHPPHLTLPVRQQHEESVRIYPRIMIED